MTTKTIEVIGLRHSYRGASEMGPRAIEDVSFEVEKGEFFALLGPSGCGKTTTLRCLAGLERPTAGEIRLGGELVVGGKHYVAANRRDIGMVFQDYAVWPHMTVYKNVAFPLRFMRPRLSRTQVRERVERVLTLVGLDRLASRKGTELSGGQQQRIALARALVREPEVLLLDEPLSNLDASLRERLREELREIQRQVGVTTVLVTHDQTEALSMANRIALMNEGRIVQLATPQDLYEKPTTEFSARFLGVGALYSGKVAAVSRSREYTVDTKLGRIRAVSFTDHSVGDDVMVAVRSDRISLHPKRVNGDNVFAARVLTVYYLGSAVDVQLDAAGQVIRARCSSTDFAPEAGDDVFFSLAASDCVVVTSGS